VVALREIEEGLVNEEMMEAALAQPAEEEMPFDEDDLAAALHAEISRELTQPAPEGQSTLQSTTTTPALTPFGGTSSSTTEPPATAQAAPESTEAESTLSMEELLAKELANSSDETPDSANPFSESATSSDATPESSNPFTDNAASSDETPAEEDAKPDFGLPSFTSTPDPSNDGD